MRGHKAAFHAQSYATAEVLPARLYNANVRRGPSSVDAKSS
jgi:hypothetical protein